MERKVARPYEIDAWIEKMLDKNERKFPEIIAVARVHRIDSWIKKLEKKSNKLAAVGPYAIDRRIEQN